MKKNRNGGPGLLGNSFTSRSLRFPLLNDEMNNLLGKVLTVIDASISDTKQNEAIKDLLRAHFSDKIHTVFWNWCYSNDVKIEQLEDFLQENIVDGIFSHSEHKNVIKSV